MEDGWDHFTQYKCTCNTGQCLLSTPCTYAIHAAPETWRMAGITSPNTNVLVIQVNVCSLHRVPMPSMQHLKHGGWPDHFTQYKCTCNTGQCLLSTLCTYAIHAAPETWRMAVITSPNTNVLVIQVNVCSLHCVRMPSMQHLKHGGWP